MSDLLGTPETATEDPPAVEPGPYPEIFEAPAAAETPEEPVERRTLRKRRPPARALPNGANSGGPPPPPVYPSGRTPEQFWASIAVPSIWAVVVAVLVGAAVGLFSANNERTRAPSYESVTVILFDNPTAIAVNPASVLSIANDRGKYAGLIATDAFAIPAAQRIGGVTPAQIEGQVRPVIDGTSLNLDIAAFAGDPLLAQKLSLGASEYLVDYVNAEQSSLPLVPDSALRLQVRIISNPRPGRIVSPTHQKEITAGAIYGGLALVVTYVAAQLIADRVRVRRRLAAASATELTD